MKYIDLELDNDDDDVTESVKSVMTLNECRVCVCAAESSFILLL
jgi:hypothetical protein